MSPNVAANDRLKVDTGEVVDVKENPRGFYVTVEFDE